MKFDRAKMLEQHAKATVNLYGAISLAEWDDIFHQHYGKHLELDSVDKNYVTAD